MIGWWLARWLDVWLAGGLIGGAGRLIIWVGAGDLVIWLGWLPISCQGVCERFPSYLLQRPDSPSFRQVSHFHLLGQHSTFYRFYQSFGTQIRRLQPDFALSIIHKKRRMEICQIPVLEERIPITFSLALKKRSRSQPCQMLGWKLLFR